MTRIVQREPDGIADRLYEELRRVAAGCLRHESPGHTLQPTALVHEAWLRLGAMAGELADDEPRFRAVAAGAMRHILLDHARRKNAKKRGGSWLRITLSDAAQGSDDEAIDVLALDEAMTALAELDERKARVVEMRFFGGMTCQEAADTLGISPKTVEADWYFARAWLHQKLDAPR